MPQPKEAQQGLSKQSGSCVDFTRAIPSAVTQNELGCYLPSSDILSMHQTSKKLKELFQVQMDVLKTLKYVVAGNVDALMALINDNPGLLFKKGEVKAPRGQTYCNVSPYILMNFLCDEDMLAHIIPLIPERFNQVRQVQDAELGRGGSDLVKLDFDPMSVTDDDFNKICAFKTRVNVWNRPRDITFPLLENPDGLLYWKDAQDEVNFYYANRETQTVTPIIPVASTPEEHKALEVFKNSFDEMESNSARRSTNEEHQLISKLMQQALHRQGIHYSNAPGEHYCDSRTSFQLINRYRTVIRLYEEAVHNGQWERAHHYWRERFGTAQGEEMWILQRICEPNRPFNPLPEKFDEFEREFVFYNWSTQAYESVFIDGQLVEGFGSDFALYKGGGVRGHHSMPIRAGGSKESGGIDLTSLDLIAVCRFVTDAKTKISVHMLESEPVLQPDSLSSQSISP